MKSPLQKCGLTGPQAITEGLHAQTFVLATADIPSTLSNRNFCPQTFRPWKSCNAELIRDVGFTRPICNYLVCSPD